MFPLNSDDFKAFLLQENRKHGTNGRTDSRTGCNG